MKEHKDNVNYRIKKVILGSTRKVTVHKSSSLFDFHPFGLEFSQSTVLRKRSGQLAMVGKYLTGGMRNTSSKNLSDDQPIPPDKQIIDFLGLVLILQQIKNAVVKSLGIRCGVGAGEHCGGR